MNAREIATEIRLSQWAQEIQERKASGLSIKEYCLTRGIGRDAYFYWQRKLKDAACGQLTGMHTALVSANLNSNHFTEVKFPTAHTRATFLDDAAYGRVQVEISGMRIVADEAYPPSLLAELLKGLMKAC
jgi:hypothetical protein